MSDSFVLSKRDICTETGVIKSLVHTNTRPPLHARFMYAQRSSIHSKNQQSLFQAKPQSKVTQRRAERVISSEQFPVVGWIGMYPPHPGWSTSPEASQLQASRHGAGGSPGAEPRSYAILCPCFLRPLGKPPLKKSKDLARRFHTRTHTYAQTHTHTHSTWRDGRAICAARPPLRAAQEATFL